MRRRILDKEMQIPQVSPETLCYHVKNVLIRVTNHHRATTTSTNITTIYNIIHNFTEQQQQKRH